VIVAGRTFDRAKALAESLGCEIVGWERLIEARAQIVANATPVGMQRDESPYPPELWKRDMVAFDAVYTPRETRFLREARAAGAETADGVEMFLRQANLQLRTWIGRTMPTEVYKELARTL
jgi:shikimate 5-dehydrogenase